ncbi:MAG TPA: hypothetical protein VM124_02690 [Candidatus Limnocylindrales bacterium]|nr:hypothetical protein [Candidatus Limnocylindrales bacterium]
MPKANSKPPTNKQAKKTQRRLRQPTYKSFRYSKRIRQPKAPLRGAFRLLVGSTGFLFKRWKLFGGIALVYLILTIVFVKGFGVTSNISQLRDTVQGLFQGSTAGLATGFTLFSVLLSNANSTSSDVAGAYQSMLLLVISLVLIWALRHALADKKTHITIRDAFYKGLYPLVPFLLVLLVIGLQLVPMLIANFLYAAVFQGGLAVSPIEQGLWAVLLILLVVLSLYMVSSSVFALYIVTLPDVRPLQALKSARDLVRHRRLVIMRKVLFLPVALLVLAALIIVPVIMVSPVVAEWLFFGLSMLAVAIVHSYMYHLYREML